MSGTRTGGASQRGRVVDSGSIACTFPLHPSSVRLARRAAQAICRFWRAPQASDTAALAVSELFGNAVKTGAGGEATLRMSWTPRRLRVEVCDSSAAAPVLREAQPLDEGGRGLWIISQLAVRWGTQPCDTGKCVWAEFALPAAA